MARLLIEQRANLDLVSEHIYTALMFAVGRLGNDVSVPNVQLMIAKNVDMNVQNNEGKTALMIALERRNDEIGKALIEHGANLHLIDRKGITALILAIQYSLDSKLIEMIIEKNVDMDFQDAYDRTPLLL